MRKTQKRYPTDIDLPVSLNSANSPNIQSILRSMARQKSKSGISDSRPLMEQ